MRRALLVVVLLVAGCSKDRTVSDASLDAFQYKDAGVDAPSCAPTGTCVDGPACGSTCCASGEQCVNGTCMCGSTPACTGGDTCNGGGGFVPLPCGVVCCGVTVGCPI